MTAVRLSCMVFSRVAVHFKKTNDRKRKRKVGMSAKQPRLPGRHSVAWTF